MKELTNAQQEKVIKLFLAGDTYDDIVIKTGTSKGSVVNIVEAFRNGEIQLPPGTSGYVDMLRQMAVDMRKQQVTAVQLKAYLALHQAVQQAGIDAAEAYHLITACQEAVAPTVTGKEFCQAAVELAQAMAASGKTPAEIIADYTDNLQKSAKLEQQIAQQQQALADLKKTHDQQITQHQQTLHTLSDATKTAQTAFGQLQADLKAQRDALLQDHQLTLKKINVVAAILQDKLSQAGLGKATIQTVSDRITEAGSLTIYLEKLATTKKEEEARCNNFKGQNGQLESRNKELQDSVARLNKNTSQLSALEIVKRAGVINLDMEARKLEAIIVEQKELITVAYWIIGFLLNPDVIKKWDFEELTKLMFYAREYRNKLAGKEMKYIEGDTVVEGRLPKMSFDPDIYGVSYDKARKTLALCLVNLVKPEFISRNEQNMNEILELSNRLTKFTYGNP